MELKEKFSDKLLRKIEQYEIISFDLFDTLIKRDVKKPEDIFRLIENTFKDSLKEIQFAKERKEAYQRAYEKQGARCTLNDIYMEIKGIGEEQKDELKNYEIELEKLFCSRNESIFALYEYVLLKKKRIVIITDMYMPMEIIESIIDNCDISGFEKIFLSCEYGSSKTDGALFDLCCSELQIQKSQLFHIGDGWKNDFLRARMKGIAGFWVRDKKRLDYDSYDGFNDEESFEYSIQQAVIKNHLSVCQNEVEKLGFETFGPLVYGFSLWLRNNIKALGIKKIFFLAREGLFMKNVFEALFNECDIECHYLYASRRSLVIPSYWIYSNYEDVVSSIAKSSFVTVYAMLERWGLQSNEYEKELEECELKGDDILDGTSLVKNERLHKLYNLIKQDIVDNSKEEFVLLSKYLKQENFRGNCAIVDVGWNGAMQLAMEKIIPKLDEKVVLHGFYLGINSKNLGMRIHNIHGYLYEQEVNQNNRYFIYSFAGPLELSFTAAHGTTVGYDEKRETIIPVFGKGEYILEDGSLTDELKYTILVQRGASRYVDIMKKYTFLFEKIESEVAFKNCKLFGLMPLKKHISIFQSFTAKDLGQTQHFVSKNYNKLRGENSITKGFWNSTWKSGYMKSVFRLPLPYYKIYVAMRKRRD